MCEVFQDAFVCESDSRENVNLSKKCVPTQTQIREQLGGRLSDVFFENLCPEARIWLGLTPFLVGPDTVWIDPEARLKGKVSATPVPEPVDIYLKSLTHGSVLEIGQKYIMLIDNKHKKEMEEALKKQAMELEDEFKRRLLDVELNGMEGQTDCKKVVATLIKHFDKCFDEFADTTRLQMRKECQLNVERERAEIAAYMLTQVQDEVARRDYELCSDFHDVLNGELNILATRYIKQIEIERNIAVTLLKETILKYEKMLRDLKMEMEFSSVVDVCRAINSERIECNDRIKKIRSQDRENQETLMKYIENLKTENCTLQKMSTDRLKRLMVWKEKVHVLLQEFQRFINFALEAVPGQSEFLISLEKLMLKTFPEDMFLLPADYLHYQNCLKEKLEPCKEEAGSPEPEKLSSKSSEPEKMGECENAPSHDDVICQSFKEGDETSCKLNFNYDKFKEMLMRRFSSGVTQKKGKKKPRKMICYWKERSKKPSVDKSNEWYQALNVVGETEKEHQIPVNCFLEKRKRAILKVCRDDPEFAKIVLGCSHK